jgi:hypothetical protein
VRDMSDLIDKPDWILSVIRDRGPGNVYRFHIEGINLSDNGRAFSWDIPEMSLDQHRYDTSDALTGPWVDCSKRAIGCYCAAYVARDSDRCDFCNGYRHATFPGLTCPREVKAMGTRLRRAGRELSRMTDTQIDAELTAVGKQK